MTRHSDVHVHSFVMVSVIGGKRELRYMADAQQCSDSAVCHLQEPHSTLPGIVQAFGDQRPQMSACEVKLLTACRVAHTCLQRKMHHQACHETGICCALFRHASADCEPSDSHLTGVAAAILSTSSSMSSLGEESGMVIVTLQLCSEWGSV